MPRASASTPVGRATASASLAVAGAREDVGGPEARLVSLQVGLFVLGRFDGAMCGDHRVVHLPVHRERLGEVRELLRRRLPLGDDGQELARVWDAGDGVDLAQGLFP